MIRDRLNKIFTSKGFYIVFSLLVSVALWLFVELSLKPTVVFPLEVPIVYLNKDLLDDKNFVITKRSTETVSLTIECKQELRAKLNASTVYVTVDLGNITKVGPAFLPYEVLNTQGIPKGQLSITRRVDTIVFNIDKMFSKPIQVTGEYKGGTASEDLFAEAVEFSTSSITISGPEEAVAHVDRAYVDIKRENLQRTAVMENQPIILLDSGGEVIDDEALLESLELSQDTVNITIPIKMRKDVALAVDLVPGAGASVQNANINITPKTITITGDPDAMRDYNTLVIGTVDLAKVDGTFTDTFPISVQNVFGYQGETEAIVSVEIIGLETRHFLATNLQTTGAAKGLKATILTQSLDIRIRGKAEDLDALLPENISVVADVTDYKEGGVYVPVKIIFLGTVGDVGPVGGEYRIHVTITKES